MGWERGRPPLMWPGGVIADAPECFMCTWVWASGGYRLKFANAACPQHARLLRSGEV